MWTPQNGTYWYIDGDDVVIHIEPKNKTTYGYMHWGAIDDADLSKDVTLNADGSIDITVDKSYCGYAHPIAPIKKKLKEEGDSWTTSEQYYLAIPAAIKDADKTAAEAVDEKIDSIGEATLANKAAVTEAREAYDALSDAQKQLVTKYAVLKAAEDALNEAIDELAKLFEYDGDSVAFIKKDGSLFGMWRPKEGVESTCGISGDDVVIVYYPNKTTHTGFHWGTIYDEKLTRDVSINDDGALVLTLDKSKYCGYAYPVAPLKSDDTTTGDQYYLAVPAESKLPDLDAEAAADVEALIEAIGEVTLDSEEAITVAREAYEALNENAQHKVTNLAVLEAAEEKLAQLKKAKEDEDAAAAVEEKIDAIGEVTLSSEAAISEAREAYDALTEDQQELVENYETLTAAEEKLEQLKKEASDAELASAVEEQIAAIGEVTLDSEKAIEAARKAYDALTDDQKELVENYKTLTDAEEKLAQLKKEKEEADEKAKADAEPAAAVDEKIDAIGKVTLDSEEAINAAREAYDALTEDQQDLVKNYETLTAAEEKLEELKKAAEKPEEGTVDLEITNNINMFKAVSASLVTDADGNQTLVVALSGTGYLNLFKGTYEEAVANGDNRANWIVGYENSEGKIEFRIPVDAGESYIPVVAISDSYLKKYEAGSNPLSRAFYPRQMELDVEAKTLVVDDYKNSVDLTVTNNVKMFKVDGAALTTVGGPNSNSYATTLDLTMGSDSFDKAFIGRASKAGSSDVEVKEIKDRELSLTVRWIETAGDPDTVQDLMEDVIIVSFHSVAKDAWYERQFTIDEDAATLVIDEAAEEEEEDTTGVVLVSVKDKSGEKVAFEAKKVDEDPQLDKKTAVKLTPNVNYEEEIDIRWQRNVTVPEGTTFPVTLEFKVDDVEPEQEIYVYHYDGKEWKLVATGKNGKVSAKLDKLSPISLAVNTADLVAKTGDTNQVFLWGALAVAALAAVVILVFTGKKRREE